MVPVISVLLPVYNDSEYLEASIQSILNQTFQDFELLILDDGSEVPIWQIVEKFEDSRIQYHRFDHRGLTHTLNRGINLTKSKYVARQDADDLSSPYRFEFLSSILEKDQSKALVGSSCQFINENNNVVANSSYPTEHDDLVKYLQRLKNPFPHSSTIFRRRVAVELNGYNNRFPRVQDYEFWLRISERYKIASCANKLCQIRFRQDSLAHSHGTPEQFKFTLLGFILHQRRMNGHEDIPDIYWEDYFNEYQSWYYTKIAPTLADIWTYKIGMISSFYEKELFKFSIFGFRILKEIVKRIFQPKAREIISNIPKELLNLYDDNKLY
jgi:glycosyltransferase involved in cell wall biosynthesis